MFKPTTESLGFFFFFLAVDIFFDIIPNKQPKQKNNERHYPTKSNLQEKFKSLGFNRLNSHILKVSL